MIRRTIAALPLLALGITLQAQTPATQDSVVQLPAVNNLVVVNGVISDAVTRKPLRGVRITYKDQTAAITDSIGSFSIKVPHYQVALRVEADGYQLKEIALKGSSAVKAALHEDGFPSLYDEVMMPFGPIPKSSVSNAVVSVQNTNNWQNTPESPDAFLQGKVAGLNAIRRSGTPNIGANLFIRGYSSLYAGNQPLVIVDGVFFDIDPYGGPLTSGFYNNPLSFIDNKDIDNITVIKDASSIYGAKGAGGAILITTARTRQEATRIDASLYGGVNFAPEQMPVMNATDYRLYLGEMLQSKGLSDKDVQALPYMNDNPSSPGYYRYHYNTGWQDKVFSGSDVQNGHLKITGGDNIAKYALSIGFLKNKGIVRGTGLTRYNTRFNSDFNLSSRLTASASLSFLYNEQKLKNMGIDPKTNPVYTALIKAPFLPDHEVADNGIESPSLADKDTFNVSNPTALIQNMQAINKSYRFNGAVSFKYLLAPHWSLATTISVTLDKTRESFFIPQRGVVSDTLDNAVAKNRSGAQVIRMFEFYNDTRLSYSKTFHRIHQLDVRLGARYARNTSEQDNGYGFNSATDQLTGVGYGLNTLRRIGGSMGAWSWLNTYLNADYNLSGKYFLSLNIAGDGSTRFGKNIQPSLASFNAGNDAIALFPSLGGSWLISSERFMAAHRCIDLLKLRASVGVTGNDDIGNFTARKYYSTQNLLGISGLVRGNLGNEQLQWESVVKANAGLDISLFNERLSLSVDAYRHTTDKMIVYQPLATAAGFDYAITNSGGMKTTGWEATVNARVMEHSSFKWDIAFNIAQYKSVVTALPAGAYTTSYAGGTMITGVGSAPNLFYGHKTNGLFLTDAAAQSVGFANKNADGTTTPFRGGDVQFVNMNGDKLIDDKDRQVIGNPNPDFYGGISTHMTYKNWSFEALGTFSVGNDVYNYTRRQLESMTGYANQSPIVVNRWRTDGQHTNTPRATWGDPVGNSRFSDRWIEDASYFRVKTASVSYNIPLKAGAVKYATVFLTGNNIITLTRYMGYDPEFSAGPGVYEQGVDILPEPQYRSIQLGMRVGL